LVVLWLAPLAGMVLITRLQFQFLPLLTVTTLGMLVRRIALERNGRRAAGRDATPRAPVIECGVRLSP